MSTVEVAAAEKILPYSSDFFGCEAKNHCPLRRYAP